MVEVKFTADNIADLKLQIQEYSLAHLGLDFKAMAGQMMGPPEPKDGKRLNDGTVRLHNPSYPGPQTNVPPQVKRKRGRVMGWRKTLKPAPEESTPSQPESPPVKEPVQDSGVGPILPDPQADAKKLVKDTIHDLHRVKGFQAAKEALEKFGAKHLNDLPADKYEDFIKYAIEVVNGSV